MAQCVCCYINIDDSNIVKYLLINTNTNWKTYDYCSDCTIYLLHHKWADYINSLKKADCEKELRNLLSYGLPIYITHDTRYSGQLIEKLYFKNMEYSGKLEKHIDDNTAINLAADLKYVADNWNIITDYLIHISNILTKYNL